ncbi:MAG: response regulator [Deltaproteobacteria bacterium]|nr:response regulator [Deltaproteobacteria bacterium]
MDELKPGENPPRILVVDDEAAIRRLLATVLESSGFVVHLAENGSLGLAAAAAVRPDLILLDLGLPDLDGVEVIRRLREWSPAPIIVLSVREREDDKVAALDAGADDYLTKPFGVPELLARIRGSLRRVVGQAPEPIFRSGGLEVDLARRLVRVVDQEVQLTPTEYEILRILVTHAGKVLTHRQLLSRIWGSSHLEQPHVLRVNISNLRHKIERDPSRPSLLLTESGVGYRLRAES